MGNLPTAKRHHLLAELYVLPGVKECSLSIHRSKELTFVTSFPSAPVSSKLVHKASSSASHRATRACGRASSLSAKVGSAPLFSSVFSYCYCCDMLSLSERCSFDTVEKDGAER
jgi:hypothetical protein